ncbi:unnamed protein product [Urochloa decumbens]|uniref:Glycosyltransferase n=1 Tax=Urochloa decumbens TaxID=240449 RepID=A0ABC9B0C6_9POAL
MAGRSSPSAAARPLRIVLCPWLAFGHMLPYLELAERLASRGHRVSYVSTPRNLARLPPPRHAVDLVSLPLPLVEDGAGESTNEVPYDKVDHHWRAFDGLAVPFAEFLAAACADEGRRPDWVIADTFHHWAAAAALEYKVPCAMLLPTAAMIASVWHRPEHAGGRPSSVTPGVFEEPKERPEGVLRYEWENRAHFFNNYGSGMSSAQRCSLTLRSCTITAMRSCPEWELEAFPLAARILGGKPLVPLGLLPPSPDGGRMNGSDHAATTMRWLDAQPACSVVYVALGSEVPLPVALVHEMAHGLELAGTRFLWALRKPPGVPGADVLPAGFSERTQDRGLVSMEWVPQISILAHAAMGAFLTHCGRNSLIDGLLFGHPLVMLPIFGDQGPNARAMERRKVGLQVARNEDDGSFDRHGIASTVRDVMVEGEARKAFVANARKMQGIVAGKELQERYVDEFVQILRSYLTDGGTSSTAAGTTPPAET